MQAHDSCVLLIQFSNVLGTGRRLALVLIDESLAGTGGRLRCLALVKGEIILVHIHQDGEHLLPVGICLFRLSLCLSLGLLLGFLSLLLSLLGSSLLSIAIILTTALLSFLPAPPRIVAILLCNPLHVFG